MGAIALEGIDSPRQPGLAVRLLCLLALVLPVLVGGVILVRSLTVLLEGQTWQDLGRSARSLESLSMLLCLDAAALLCLGWGLTGLAAALRMALRHPGHRSTPGLASQDPVAALPRLPRPLRRAVWILVGAQAALALPGMPAQARTSPASPEHAASDSTAMVEAGVEATHPSSAQGSAGKEPATAAGGTPGTGTAASAADPGTSPKISPLFGTAFPETTTVSADEADQASSISVIETRNSAEAEQLSPLFGGQVRSPANAVEQAPEQSDSARPAGADHQEWVVLRGQTLWSIAAARLPVGASTAEVARMVSDLYDHNRDVLVDGPDLILPGMVLDLTGS